MKFDKGTLLSGITVAGTALTMLAMAWKGAIEALAAVPPLLNAGQQPPLGVTSGFGFAGRAVDTGVDGRAPRALHRPAITRTRSRSAWRCWSPPASSGRRERGGFRAAHRVDPRPDRRTAGAVRLPPAAAAAVNLPGEATAKMIGAADRRHADRIVALVWLSGHRSADFGNVKSDVRADEASAGDQPDCGHGRAGSPASPRMPNRRGAIRGRIEAPPAAGLRALTSCMSLKAHARALCAQGGAASALQR